MGIKWIEGAERVVVDIVISAEDASVEFRVWCEARVIEGIAEMIARAPGADVAGVEASKLGVYSKS